MIVIIIIFQAIHLFFVKIHTQEDKQSYNTIIKSVQKQIPSIKNARDLFLRKADLSQKYA